MNKSNQKYWFYLEFYVYMNVQNDILFLFNTLDNNYLLSKNENVINLFSKLSKEETGVIGICHDDIYTDQSVREFLNLIRAHYFGDIIEYEDPVKPINFMSSLKINETKETIKSNKNSNLLFTLNIYLNDICNENCPQCNNYYKQFRCCAKSLSNNGTGLNIETVRKIIDNTSLVNVSKINIIAGDITKYNHIEKLSEVLRPRKEIITIITNYKNKEKMNSIKYNSLLEFNTEIVTDINELKEEDFESIKMKNKMYNYNFIITDEQGLGIVNEINSNKANKMTPFFNKENTRFFEEYVYTNISDVLKYKIAIKDINRNRLINSHFFGELYIYPNGDVYSNPNAKTPIHNIESSNISEIIYLELSKDNSLWLFTRNKSSCKECVFQDLCPPISNYELSLNKYNMCKLFKCSANYDKIFE